MTKEKVNYRLGENGRFVVENYNVAKPFSGFFPGIAGLYGKPLWVFYVNRAQGICSFGVGSKDGAIVEFQSANKAYSLVNTNGFRTFLKITKNGRDYLYEPFREDTSYKIAQRMEIGSSDLILLEKNETLGLDIEVRYFCMPGEPYAALARELRIKNMTGDDLDIELLDGLPFILPYGFTERQTKDMSNTIPAWIEVVNLEKKIPFYKLKVIVADKPVVTPVRRGNFYLGYYFTPEGGAEDKVNFVRPVVDPSLVFGPSMDLRFPYQFFGKKHFTIPQKQVCEGITPSAMGYLKAGVFSGREMVLYSLIGHAWNISLLSSLVQKIKDREYFPKKLKESEQYINQLQDNMFTKSSSHEFNQYCKNTFLDNVLRGGFPMTLKGSHGTASLCKKPVLRSARDCEKPVVLHLFSRRHGDVERDYNKFHLKCTYFSQGDGNYRDVCQNRRNDLWFNPLVCEDNIITFGNLIQLDGYNPLVLKGDHFIVKKVPKKLKCLEGILKRPFMLGELFDYIEQNNIKIKPGRLIKEIVSIAEKGTETEFKEGYWVDHWTYIMDLFESYKCIYPEYFWQLFTEKKYAFYDSPAIVISRKDRCVIADNGNVRQYGSVRLDEEKIGMLISRKREMNKVRTRFGKGNIYKTTLLAKLLCVIANKAASFDPFGTGIEMEADRPGWYDALNGLPGLFGSSTCEVFELKRVILLVIDVISRLGESSVKLPVELAKFLKNLRTKEEYRKKTKFGISGKEEKVSIATVKDILTQILRNVEEAIGKAFDKKTGLYHTYFINEVISLKPLKVKQHQLPPFLEAQVHALRLVPGKEKAMALYKAVRRNKNGLYDKKLRMYKVNASLVNESMELGRTKVFSPGWLENESIWLHMEYKYLLELLRNGLYEEFYNDFRNVLVPFQDPAIFKRSTLESCSFIVSSAHPDSSLHGTGFLPRLTGATAEVINMWLWMCVGREPFFLDSKGKLNLKFEPILASWLFTKEKTFSFKFLGSIMVIYHNPERKDTFNIKPKRIRFDGMEFEGNVVPSPYAERIRERIIKEINIYF